MNINENFLKIESSYLFSNIAKKVKAYTKANPDKEIIRLGIGDVTRPLAPACIEAMHKAVDEMADEKTFRGYPPEYGYDFLLNAINENDYRSRGIELDNSEIFVSDGAKSDTGNIGDIFSLDNKVAICDPVYPVYVDTNVMSGRSGEKDENGKYICRERYSGSYSRSFYVGDAVTEQDISAKFENGTLKLTVPKKEALPEKQNKYIAIG